MKNTLFSWCVICADSSAWYMLEKSATVAFSSFHKPRCVSSYNSFLSGPDTLWKINSNDSSRSPCQTTGNNLQLQGRMECAFLISFKWGSLIYFLMNLEVNFNSFTSARNWILEISGKYQKHIFWESSLWMNLALPRAIILIWKIKRSAVM